MLLALIAIWALAEATVFFIVADVPIMALGIKAGARKALIGACVAAVFAAVGGGALCIWASENPARAYDLMLAVPAINAQLIEQVAAQFEEYGLVGMVVGSFTGVPYKLYAFAASSGPLETGPVALFAIASIIARLPRFALIALVSGWAGPRLIRRFGAARVWIAFAVCWTGFYAWYWSAMGW